MHDSSKPSSRPSFRGFWQKSKDQQAGKNLTFISSNLGQSTEAEGSGRRAPGPSAEDKAKARRQQVRRAQLQHRQRKANYTQQLELDITKLRDDIAAVEREVEGLRIERGALRSQLTGVVPHAVSVPGDIAPSGGLGAAPDMAFSTSLAPEYTVSLDTSHSVDLGYPAFQVRRTSLASSPYAGGSKTAVSIDTLNAADPPSIATVEMALTEEQTDQAINFILSLERCCWNHIGATCFEHNHDHQDPIYYACPFKEFKDWQARQQGQGQEAEEEEPSPAIAAAAAENETLNGHALMATALALQSAPLEIFARIGDVQDTPPLSHSLSPSPPATTIDTPPAPIAWASRSLTLANLRRLAGTVNPTEAELAPVQVWFELAALHGVAVATDAAVLAALEKALAAQMRCVLFGAMVPRDMFEEALARVGLAREKAQIE
ncbi:hypothetical protein F4861DRAFT_37921 [Xylaria intraflava]|nr:hypothetical protein F4861DRAFT_37921 [Xylaria intraflava]